MFVNVLLGGSAVVSQQRRSTGQYDGHLCEWKGTRVLQCAT